MNERRVRGRRRRAGSARHDRSLAAQRRLPPETRGIQARKNGHTPVRFSGAGGVSRQAQAAPQSADPAYGRTGIRWGWK